MAEERSGTAVRGDRFSDGPARSFLSAMDVDERIFDADIAVDRAHVVMLAEQDVIEDDAAGKILEALSEIEAAGYDALPSDAEDVHEAIESAVIDRIGTTGGRMHTARSRNDEVATCLRYRVRDDLLSVVEATIELREALHGCAVDQAETVMPGHTHLQPAQPTTVGHWAASYLGPIERDTERLLSAYDRVNQSPLGAAAFAGTPFPIDRERTASLLGFDGIVENSMDATTTRDVLQEAVGATVTLGTTLSGLAADIVLFAHRDWLSLDDDYASTSSIMPQKKNPDTMELVRASAGDAVAGASGLATTLKGLPRAYNRDLQAASRHVWGPIDQLDEATAVTAGAIGTATWHEAALAAAAGDGFSTATGIADRLAAGGMPFRDAHTVVAAVAEDVDSDPDPDDVIAALETAIATTPDLGELSTYADPADIAAVLDPMGSVEKRDSRGGPAPKQVAAQCETAHAAIDAHRAALADRLTALADAATTLETEVGHYV